MKKGIVNILVILTGLVLMGGVLIIGLWVSKREVGEVNTTNTVVPTMQPTVEATSEADLMRELNETDTGEEIKVEIEGINDL
jgi:regulatory protein YycH of two-component signal transduction system YycFG